MNLFHIFKATTPESLYKSCNQPMLALAWSLLGNQTDAEDVVQSTWCSALEHWRLLGSLDEASARNYLLRVVMNKARDLQRFQQKHTQLSPELLEAEHESEEIGLLQLCYETLPPREQQVLWLQVVDGYSYQEIADMLGLTTANVAKILQRTKNKLRMMYMEERANGI